MEAIAPKTRRSDALIKLTEFGGQRLGKAPVAKGRRFAPTFRLNGTRQEEARQNEVEYNARRLNTLNLKWSFFY